MSNILFVTSSPRRDSASYSDRVTIRDLSADPLPHIDDDFVTATRSPGGPQTDAQKAIAAGPTCWWMS